MLRNERRQLRADFGYVPLMLSRYIPDDALDGAIKMVRQVNGVTTYLSWAATGKTRMEEGVAYASAVAAIDVVTDHYNEAVHGQVQSAIDGDPPRECLELVPIAIEMSRSPGLDTLLLRIAHWQDESLAQFDNPGGRTLEELTVKKGGWSAVAHLHAIKDPVTDEEADFMMEFGHVMQLLDDYVDCPEDEREGISTLFTEGHMTSDDLEARRRELISDMESLWGRSTATRRFDRLTRWHRRLGDFVNRTGIGPERVVPYYF